MNEEERASQLSALFDGELESGQSELVLRRIMKDPSLRATWGRYAVIGASLRHEPLSVAALGRDDVASRVAAALADAPALSGSTGLAPAARPGRYGDGRDLARSALLPGDRGAARQADERDRKAGV